MTEIIKKYPKLIPLLVQYAKIIKSMELARSLEHIAFYAHWEKERIKKHDEILEEVDTTRENTEFRYILAEFIEDIKIL